MPKRISPEWPVWYQPDAPLGSAVRYLASLSPKFNRVSISILKGRRRAGPFIGEKSAIKKGGSELVVPVSTQSGSLLGQIEIDSRTPHAFSSVEEQCIRQVAAELGELWPE